MTREEYAIEIKKCSFTNDKLDVFKEYIDSLEQQNTALQARIKELEEPKMCLTCKHFTQCDDDFNYCNVKSHLNGFINYTFGCIFHEPKQNQ